MTDTRKSSEPSKTGFGQATNARKSGGYTQHKSGVYGDTVGKVRSFGQPSSASLGKPKTLWGMLRAPELVNHHLSTINSPYYYHYS